MTQLPKFHIRCPTEIVFGHGTRAQALESLPGGARSVLVVRGSRPLAEGPIGPVLGAAGLALREVSVTGEPTVDAINGLRAEIGRAVPDAVLAIGGGSVIDAAKALTFLIAHDLTLPPDFTELPAGPLAQPCPVPLVVLPTTAGTGAEVTSNAVLGIPGARAKVSLRGRALFPHTAIIDPDLIASAPTAVRLHSGLDAVTQLIEAYTSGAATPFSDALCSTALPRALNALAQIPAADPPGDILTDMAWASLSSGLALGNSGLGAAHGLASIVGGWGPAPHGALCGRFLLPVLRRNHTLATAKPLTRARIETVQSLIAAAFPPADQDPLSGLESWIDRQGLGRLGDWRISPEAFTEIAALAVGASSSRKNPVPFQATDFETILKASA